MFVLTLIFYLKSKSKRNLVAKVATKPEFFSLRDRRKKGRERGREQSTKEGKGSACYKSRCFCNPPTIFSTNPIMSLSIRDQAQVRGFSAWSELTLFTGNCQVETLFQSDIIIERNETFLLFLLPQQTRQTQTTSSLSFFYCSQSTANNDQFRVNTQDHLSYNLIKHRDGHKEQNTGQPETRIMKVKENYSLI